MSDTVVVSQRGARMHYAVARIFEERHELERLYTDICAVRGWPRLLSLLPVEMLPASLRRLAGRVPRGIPVERVFSFDRIGLVAVLRAMRDASRANDTATALSAGRAFSAGVVRKGFGAAGGFYGISGECLEQLRSARERGLWTAVEQIIAPRAVVDRLLAEEHARFPGWEGDLDEDPLACTFAEREMAEWAVADVIVCPSEFVRQGVAEVGGPVGKCVVVPYGVDGRFQLPQRHGHGHRPLRVLTVGAVGLRKGAPYVMEAALRMGQAAQFRMIGPCMLSPRMRDELAAAVDLRGQVPRAEILEHFAWADVFLLPSVCEGSATVVYEAMAAGLPVVTTRNTGSVVLNGVEGFIVGRGDVDAICARLELLAEDRALLMTMSQSAQNTARHYDLAGYGRRLRDALEPVRARAAAAAGLQRAS